MVKKINQFSKKSFPIQTENFWYNLKSQESSQDNYFTQKPLNDYIYFDSKCQAVLMFYLAFFLAFIHDLK